MSTGLAVSKAMPFEEIMIMAKTFAESGMFTDAKAMGQAFVKIQAGQEIGIPPFAAMSGIHIIQGKPAIGAGLMSATVKGSGKYDYKVLQLDDKACSIDFYQGTEKLGNSTFTIADAKAAQTKNIDKFPKNMLFARAMSNGVKWYTPDVFAGPVYTPEELNVIDIPHTEELPPVVLTDYEKDLREQGSLEDLADYFSKMPKDAQEKYKSLAGELKLDFLEDISDDDFRGLLGELALVSKTEATTILKAKRKTTKFTTEQEGEINKIIAGLSKKAA